MFLNGLLDDMGDFIGRVCPGWGSLRWDDRGHGGEGDRVDTPGYQHRQDYNIYAGGCLMLCNVQSDSVSRPRHVRESAL